MVFLYPIGLTLFCLVYLPTFFLKKKSGDHLFERFGSVPEKRGREKCSGFTPSPWGRRSWPLSS